MLILKTGRTCELPPLRYHSQMIRYRAREHYFNQRNFILVIAGVALAAIAVFFIYQFKFLRPPAIEVKKPDRDIITQDSSYDVNGYADPDADLTLNGRPLYSGGSGEFTERVYLVNGVNKLEFEAKNRYGKIAKVTRYIIAK